MTAKKQKQKPLTEVEWVRVLELRVLSKTGRPTSDPASRDLITRAFETDPDRYGEMDAEVFDRAAMSIGSGTRWRR